MTAKVRKEAARGSSEGSKTSIQSGIPHAPQPGDNDNDTPVVLSLSTSSYFLLEYCARHSPALIWMTIATIHRDDHDPRTHDG